MFLDNPLGLGALPRARRPAICDAAGRTSDDALEAMAAKDLVISSRAATTGRNPRTGESIKIPASKSAKFKAGKALKDAVNEA